MAGRPVATRFRFKLRTLILFVAGLSLVLSYTGSYYRLSRRGLAEAVPHGLPGFLYVPIEEAAAREDLSRHYVLTVFFAPLNWLDRNLFRTAADPNISIMWRLSG